MGADYARADWGKQKRNTEWTRTLSGFAASAGFDAANVELVLEARKNPGSSSALFRVTKSGGGIVVNSASSLTVKVASALNAPIAPGDIWYQLWLVDTTTGENYPLQEGVIRVTDWAPS